MSPIFRTADRRHFICGSDARIIMGSDETALIRLWREKRGEAEPEDLSDNLIVQLGLVTENLNRLWYERNTGRSIECVQHRLRHPVLKWLAESGAALLPALLARIWAGRADLTSVPLHARIIQLRSGPYEQLGISE